MGRTIPAEAGLGQEKYERIWMRGYMFLRRFNYKVPEGNCPSPRNRYCRSSHELEANPVASSYLLRGNAVTVAVPLLSNPFFIFGLGFLLIASLTPKRWSQVLGGAMEFDAVKAS
jgi:hypothetical protein